MKRGTFIVNGVNSETFDTLIQDRPLIEAPTRKIEWKGAYGIDGDIPFDEGAYNNTTMELILVINAKDLIAGRQEFYKHMEQQGKYLDIIPYFDPDKIYRAMLTDMVQFENKHYYGQAQSASAKLTVKPYKYLVANGTETYTTRQFMVTNPTNYVAQPLIKVEGTGDIIVRVNNIEFKVNDVDGHVVLDSERYLAYKEGATGPISSENSKVMTREYPIFKPGTNNVMTTGTISRVLVTPRWRSLV